MPHKDPEQRCVYYKGWYAKNKEDKLRRNRTWHADWYSRNKEKKNAKSRAWMLALPSNPAKHKKYKEQTRKRKAEARRKAVLMYGGVCQCCGECRYEFMNFDHINGDGAAQRKVVTTSGFVRWLLQEKREGIRILCSNCNWSRGVHGYCPHERERAS